jgi:DNA-binding transcriptional ArsR family regulator
MCTKAKMRAMTQCRKPAEVVAADTARARQSYLCFGNFPVTLSDMTPYEARAGDPFDALGDPNRRAIVELLGGGGRSVRDIADALPISRPAVSRHLRLLKAAGLVLEEPRGTRRIYCLHAEGVEAVERYLVQVWGDAAARFRLMAENTRTEHAAAELHVRGGVRC